MEYIHKAKAEKSCTKPNRGSSYQEQSSSLSLTSFVPFSCNVSSVGCPGILCCPCRWEATGHSHCWARDVQGVLDTGLYLSIVLVIWSSMLRVRDLVQNLLGRNPKYVYMSISLCHFNSLCPATVKQFTSSWVYRDSGFFIRFTSRRVPQAINAA